MALEKLLEDLINAVKENTAALKGGKSVAEPAKEEKAGRAPRGSRESKSEAKSAGLTEAEFLEKMAAFSELPDNDDGDKEWDRRLEEVIDPILEEAKLGKDDSYRKLPTDFWPKLLGAVDAYLEKHKKDEGRRDRRSR